MSGSDRRWDDEREQLLGALERDAGEALALSRWMSAHPELSLAERATSDRYVAYLGARGFAIERGVAGLETAFVARRGSGALRVALLAEMDALPEIGHACGHNLSGPASLLAASAIAARAARRQPEPASWSAARPRSSGSASAGSSRRASSTACTRR